MAKAVGLLTPAKKEPEKAKAASAPVKEPETKAEKTDKKK